MDIEKIATSSIQNLISRNSYLEPIINDNDKTPVWDGDIFVYKTKDFHKKNKNLIGRVPVQVKGHRVESINLESSERIKFRVDKADIQQYRMDGGVVYFVVYIDKNTEKIFYNSLLPLDLERLIKRYDKQRTFEIEFKSLPVEDAKLADIFVDFIQNRKKQQGTLIPEILYIDDIEKIKDQIKEFKFSYSTIESKGSIPFKELTTRDFYIYAEPKGIGNPIPFDKVSNAIINIQDKFKVSVGKKTYYENAYIQWEKGLSRIVCGNSVKIIFNEIGKNKTADLNIKVQFKGTLNEQLNDLYFIGALMLNETFYINEDKIPYGNFKFENKEDLDSRTRNLEHIKSRLEYYGVKTDFNINTVTDQDDFKLSLLMEENPSTKKFNINLSESNLLKIKISNLLIILVVKVNKNKNVYEINDFFTNKLQVTYLLPGETDHIPISQFLILEKEGLLADNINANKIIKDIQKYHEVAKNFDYVNNFLLESIKAYDECSAQQDELRYLIEKLSEWLYEMNKEDYIYLNLAQVKYRLGKLNKIDKDKIRNIRLCNEENIEIRAATSILLEKREDAKSLIEKMELEQKELFTSYPIYQLLKYKKNEINKD